jgi:hypothetical protein
LVQWPAYLLAGVTAMAMRSVADQRRREESERVIAEWQRDRLLWEHKERMRTKT